jgi:hypothetical protein
MISDKQIMQFKLLHKKNFDEEISNEEALESGLKLIRLLELIYEPMTENEYLALQKNN